MTTLREAAKMALEALELAKLNGKAGLYPAEVEEITDAITALRAALAEPVEPVAWLHVPYPGNAISPMLSLSKHREPSIYAASVPLFFKDQL